MTIKTIQQLCYNIDLGSTEPKFAFLSDGSQAVVKLMNGPQGNLVLFNEYLCYRLALLLDIPMPTSGICIMDTNTEIQNNIAGKIMYHIQYSALNYYTSPISNECLCIGLLFHNLTTGKRDFKYISNFKRFHSFDDEADIDFVKLYLKGIKEEVETSLFNYNDNFDISSYTKFYANEFKFSSVKHLDVSENENYIELLSHIYLKYDLSKAQRLNSNEEKKLIRRVIESNNLAYSTEKILGPYNDEISFDYKIGTLFVKMFPFKDKNLRRMIGSARQWAFITSELSTSKEYVLFIYDQDSEDKYNQTIITTILSQNATVLAFDKAIDYILQKSR